MADDPTDARHLRGLDITSTEALEVWSLMYRHILENYQSGGEWLFLHYDQIMTSEGLNRLEAHTGARVDRNFPDAALKRSTPRIPVPKDIETLYLELCDLAAYKAGGQKTDGS